MKIGYVACHGGADNDPEGAIAHALRELGHEVDCVSEQAARGRFSLLDRADLILFHKWYDPQALQALKPPKAFWFWDLVDAGSDPVTLRRSANRVAWMDRVLPHVQLGFVSDGDWLARDRSGKCHLLVQGADQQVVGRGEVVDQDIPVLFYGGLCKCGQARQGWYDRLTQTYGKDFVAVGTGLTDHRPAKRELADLIARAKIVVAPAAPVTDRYCSARVFMSLGFGAFLLHPCCRFLTQYYQDGQDLVYYRDHDDLVAKIDYYLDEPAQRFRISSSGLVRTVREHTYKHRVEALLTRVKEKLGVQA